VHFWWNDSNFDMIVAQHTATRTGCVGSEVTEVLKKT